MERAMNEIRPVVQDIADARERSVGSRDIEVWDSVRAEAMRAAAGEPMLRDFLDLAVLRHASLADALGAMLARKLAERFMAHERLTDLVREAVSSDASILAAVTADLVAIRLRDPASEGYLSPFLYYKGFHALEWQRIGHFLWQTRRADLAHFLQSRVSEVFAVDIHPAVPIGTGVFIDHGTGVVIGETSVIGNDVSILQEVTLGGTGKERGDRHPKVHDGVLLAAGAKILGNIVIGRDAKVGAGSVVLHNVPPCATVAGVPARIVGWCRETVPAHAMDQTLPELDYVI
jgi:serine O-acetyltransferase